MTRKNRYGMRALEKEFPTEAAALRFLFESQHSYRCSCGGRYRRLPGRRQFQCSTCRWQISPTANTIFHKSDTPLLLWFKAILIFSNAKSGISAKELERQLEVTYKTAWRMLMQIRKALKQQGKLQGTVEMDTAYFGGVKKAGRYNKRLAEAKGAKAVVMGAVERGGGARVQVVHDSSATSHRWFLKANVESRGTKLMTDGTNVLKEAGAPYLHRTVQHGKGEYVRGDVYINSVESFWSHVKRSLTGTHKTVSKKYLQHYLDGFVFHFDNRHSDRARFGVLLGRIVERVN